MRPAVFLDRDGTIVLDREYLANPDDVELCPGAAKAIARLNALRLPVIVVTNQSGIGRGKFTEADFWRVQQRMTELLAGDGARIDGSYFCPHAPEQSPPCECRKPATGLFLKAAEEHGVAVEKAFYVGDRLRDVLPGVQLGGTGILIGSDMYDDGPPPPEILRVASLSAAAEIISATGPFD